MSSPSTISAPATDRLDFSRFSEADVPAFARLLADPEITRSIMAKATTAAQCLDCARERIDWHNSGWEALGYGVWALREKDLDGSTNEAIIGWCGLTSTSHGPTPEILYGFARSHWGRGLATEAARATIGWAFRSDVCDGIDAVIFGELNPGSSAVARRLGMKQTGRMRFDAFLPEQQLGRDVLDYEIWRLGEGACLDYRALLFQAPFKAGLLVSAGVAGETETLSNLLAAARQHRDRGDFGNEEIEDIISEAFRRGIKDCDLDVFHISRSDWVEGRAT